MTEESKWWNKVCESLENVDKVYGRVTSTMQPQDDEGALTITFKFAPGSDIIIEDPLSVEFVVSKKFPGVEPELIPLDVGVFAQYGISLENGRIKIPWMHDTKYPLSVWIFAIRDMFTSRSCVPWATPVHLSPRFSVEDVSNVSTALVGGTAGIRGKRMYMEDMEFSFAPLNISNTYEVTMYGVVDGHGGQECARFAADDLPTNIISSLRRDIGCAESLYRGYLKTDEDFLRDADCKAGCTATVMLYDHSTGVAYVANTGDTRAVVSRLGTALDITRDMKATDPMEVARIVKGGGHIANGRVLGSLAIARALGDKNLKDSPTKSIIPDPEVTAFSVTADDEFIVIATDGLWDVMSSQAVVDMVSSELASSPLSSTHKAATESVCHDRELGRIADLMANHACHVLNSQDNITVTIIVLAHRPLLAERSKCASRTGSASGGNRGYGHSTSSGGLSARGSEIDVIDYGSRISSSHQPVAGPASTSSAHQCSSFSTQGDDDLMDFLLDDSNF